MFCCRLPALATCMYPVWHRTASPKFSAPGHTGIQLTLLFCKKPATTCNNLQHPATSCNILQHPATCKQYQVPCLPESEGSDIATGSPQVARHESSTMVHGGHGPAIPQLPAMGKKSMMPKVVVNSMFTKALRGPHRPLELSGAGGC